ncbi:GGDEF domain-containing protein [Paenibacillus sp. NEAU-GSW1]|uniref:GGDEF domain-containing protein n=1 Tax=Paenibacillus sp. NEAU-GSW1 TaxID=2682486 RepID=UPI0012E14FDE|nr:GGDEF domain-containing protein [Paenibacillus sp. NEAU-GSW1]MUT64387.1 diguanylate cyclase [Paenibacillus sp. NEAU-GSW1]
MKHHLRKRDKVVRYGGDEFLICFPQLTEDVGIRAVRDKIERSFDEPFIVEGMSISLSASIGVSANHGLYVELKQLINDADQAMYAAKQKYKRNL